MLMIRNFKAAIFVRKVICLETTIDNLSNSSLYCCDMHEAEDLSDLTKDVNIG